MEYENNEEPIEIEESTDEESTDEELIEEEIRTAISSEQESQDTVSSSEIYSEDDNINYEQENNEDEREEIIDQIYQENYDLLHGEKIDGKYYIGLPAYNTITKQIVLLNVVSPISFFSYNLKQIINYLTAYSIVMINSPKKIHIMKLYINPVDKTYNAILKTHWLRIIQKKWKKIMNERYEIINKRKRLFSILYFENHGRYPNGLNYFPRLRGMLSKVQIN